MVSADIISATQTRALRQTTVEGVTEYLRGLIHRGDIGPGESLPSERQLADSLRVGRVTVRAGIATLIEEGYLVAKRGSGGGTFITDLGEPQRRWLERMRTNLHDLEDMLEFRIALERRAVKLAATRRTKANIADMAAAVEATRAATTVTAYRSADSAFHLAVATAARSPRIAAGIAESRQSLFTPTDALPYQAAISRTVDEHAAILEAITARDGEAGAALMESHINETRKLLRKLIRRASLNSSL